MNIFHHPQKSHEWWQLKVGRIGGTRFGKVLSNRKNRLVYELMNERLNGTQMIDDFVSDDMQYGIDNEDTAIELYQKETGLKIDRVGAIISDLSGWHIASVDGITKDRTIAQEVKCTMNGDIHLQRFFDGVESNYLSQCINNFAVSEEIKEVHFISYCGYRPERPMFYKVLKREDYSKQIKTGLEKVDSILIEVDEKLEQYSF